MEILEKRGDKSMIENVKSPAHFSGRSHEVEEIHKDKCRVDKPFFRPRISPTFSPLPTAPDHFRQFACPAFDSLFRVVYIPQAVWLPSRRKKIMQKKILISIAGTEISLFS